MDVYASSRNEDEAWVHMFELRREWQVFKAHGSSRGEGAMNQDLNKASGKQTIYYTF
jgi:hypothetical protein